MYFTKAVTSFNTKELMWLGQTWSGMDIRQFWKLMTFAKKVVCSALFMRLLEGCVKKYLTDFNIICMKSSSWAQEGLIIFCISLALNPSNSKGLKQNDFLFPHLSVQIGHNRFHLHSYSHTFLFFFSPLLQISSNLYQIWCTKPTGSFCKKLFICFFRSHTIFL